MIEAIELENVQNIISAVIELHPRLNIIVGTSDHGKSAIVRGINFAVMNESDIDLTNWDVGRGEGCNVAIQFDDGYIIRFKSKSKNYYTTSITEGPPLEAFRKGLPEDVKTVTRMNDINIKTQDDPYLFFQKSPGEVARMLNKAVGNQTIDIYYKRIDKIINDAKRQEANIKDTIKENKEKHNELKWLDGANKDIEKIEKLSNSVDTKKSRMEEIKTSIETVEENQEILKQIKEWLSVESMYKSVILKFKEYAKSKIKFEERFKELDGIIKKCNTLYKRQKELKDILEMEHDAKYVLSLIKNIAERKNKIVQIKNALQSIETAYGRSEQLRIRVKKLKNKHKQMLIDAKICPVCKQSTVGL